MSKIDKNLLDLLDSDENPEEIFELLDLLGEIYIFISTLYHFQFYDLFFFIFLRRGILWSGLQSLT